MVLWPQAWNITYFPEPVDNYVIGAVATLVLGVLSPVVHIHVSQTTHEQLWGKKPNMRFISHIHEMNYTITDGQKTHLELIFIKDLDQILRDQLKESLEI